ncbi:MAG: hypothetical protein OEZ43_15240 [Gammaproteobacteria bacterium]|nr:hypothetical protein [Gammaproteobacteria bacterium]
MNKPGINSQSHFPRGSLSRPSISLGKYRFSLMSSQSFDNRRNTSGKCHHLDSQTQEYEPKR